MAHLHFSVRKIPNMLRATNGSDIRRINMQDDLSSGAHTPSGGRLLGLPPRAVLHPLLREGR